ncbi:MAG: ParB/RepB/Spo0J family partition protein [Bacilli bacterium]|nr:ParB/RepB/Spo0J family partition protein [Bacilli bacterium]
MNFNLDDFYTTQEQRDENKKEKIEEIDISLIDSFKNHPFKVLDNEELNSLEESIKNNGLMEAVIIRPKEDGRYEMVSGHRRLLACKKLGLDKIPSIVRNLSQDEATIYMVDSNLHREKLLPSEKAFAYKMKYEAIKHQGKTFGPLDQKLDTSGPIDRKSSAEILGDEHGESEKTVRRYIRLTYLIPELLQMVDNSELNESPSIAIRPAVELSYLITHEQRILAEYIEYNLTTPSLEQAKKLKELSKNGVVDETKIEELLDQPKANQIQKIKISEEKLFTVVPKNVDRTKLEDFVLKACEFYSKHLKNRERER